MARVKRREEPTPLEEARAWGVQYVLLKQEIKEKTSEADKLKGRLNEFLDADGEEDDKGNLWMDLPEPVDGIRSIKRERKAKQGVDEVRALAILQDKGLEDACYEMVPTLNTDAVMEQVRKGTLTDEELAEMFPETVQWALVMSKS